LIKSYLSGGPGLTLGKREILGLYLEKEQLQYVCLTMTRKGWIPKQPGPTLEPSGCVQAPAPWSLKQFLEWLTVLPLVEGFSPSQKRSVYLALPRRHFSARDLQLPPMTMEDALVSVQNSLAVCCHLPLEDIYYDIHLCRTNQGNINALILYAPRKDMDSYLDIFRETGHLDSLKGLFPVSFGIGAWLNIQRYPMPLGLHLSQNGAYELAVYQKKGCLFSGTLPLSDGKQGVELLAATAKSKFQGLGDNIFYLDNGGTPGLPSPSTNRLARLPWITENLAVAAASPALAGQQEISIDGNPTRLTTLRSGRVLIPLILFLILIISLMTLHTDRNIARQEQNLRVLTTEISELQELLKPMEQDRKTLRKTNRFLQDINDFKKTRPRLFSHINEVARCLPEDTWFSYLDFQKGLATLRGESPDALRVVEALRSSGKFEQVNLRGSVTSNKTGAEKFSLTIKLKDHDADR
jgi:Tfp pilus assembly protein PilN